MDETLKGFYNTANVPPFQGWLFVANNSQGGSDRSDPGL